MDKEETKPFTAKAELCDQDGQTKFASWVAINPNGALSMSSIDVGTSPNQFLEAEDHEQWVAVPASAKDALLFELLKEKYTGNPSALLDFKEFLKKHGIPQTSDFWISFN